MRTGARQRIEHRSAPRGIVRARKEIIPPSDCDRSELSLREIVVQQQSPVIDETGKRDPLIEHVTHCLREFTRWWFVGKCVRKAVFQFVQQRGPISSFSEVRGPSAKVFWRRPNARSCIASL